VENASLDEFLDNSESEDESEADEESEGGSGAPNGGESGDGAGSGGEETLGEDTPESRDGGDSEKQRDPSTPISRCRPSGQGCAVCERGVTRLWSDDGRLVCADCKDWA